MNILVIEDEPALRKTISVALGLGGHHIVEAETGVEALERVDEQRPDLIVLDLQMPEMDGWEFLDHFRAYPDCADVPAIVVSAAHRVRLEDLRAQAFLAKPFDLDEFLDAVDRLLAAVTAKT